VAPVALVAAIWMARWFIRTVGARTLPGTLILTAIGVWLPVPVLEARDPHSAGRALWS